MFPRKQMVDEFVLENMKKLFQIKAFLTLMFKTMLNVYNYAPVELLGSLASFLLCQRWIPPPPPMAGKFYKKGNILKMPKSQEYIHLFKPFSVV